MYRPRREQRSLFSPTTLLSDEKRRRLERSWAGVFRAKALPLIDEELFRHLFHEDNGRPNKPVQTVVGLLVIKDMYDLTDLEILERLEFDLMVQMALGLDVDEAHCSQKTLHNFRTKLIASKTDVLVFQSLTDRIVESLGVNIGKQRLDSTHIVSNIARLTRLGLFCETIIVFLSALKRDFPKKFGGVSEALRKRYLKDDGTSTRFGDAASQETRRRLSVCARDVWRLVDRFRGDKGVVKLEAYQLLERLLDDQCSITSAPKSGGEGDADVSEPGVPVEVKDPQEVRSDSLQTPHDPDATYSGHKGKGYEVQVAETHGNGNVPEIITHVEVTRSCDGDERALPPVVSALAARDLRPDEITADTTYGSIANVLLCDELGTELVSPVPGSDGTTKSGGGLCGGNFFVDPNGEQPAICPKDHTAVMEERNAAAGTIRAYFDGSVCDRCENRDTCPARRLQDGTRAFHTTEDKAVLELRRYYQETEEFKERYAQRAGIEGTNSELKRRHGLGRLRVRRQKRVRLAVYLKAVACNIKRMVMHFVDELRDSGSSGQGALAAAN